MIGRLFFIIAIFLLGWIAFRYFRTQLMLKEQQQDKQSRSGEKASIKEVKPCSYCGVHMPQEEMLSKEKLHFCSYQHMLDFEQKNK